MTQSNFIMLPTVDFCFKELMQNPKVRKGFISALLDLSPDEVEDTVLLPTLLPRDSAVISWELWMYGYYLRTGRR